MNKNNNNVYNDNTYTHKKIYEIDTTKYLQVLCIAKSEYHILITQWFGLRKNYRLEKSEP